MAIKKNLLITLEFPPQHGGVGSYYYNICKHLPTDSVIVLAPHRAQAETFDANQPFTIIRSRLLQKLGTPSRLKLINWWRQWRLLTTIKNAIHQHQIDCLHVGNVLPLGTLALILKRRNHIPYLLYSHGLDVLLPQRSVRKKALLKRAIQNADWLVANSEFTHGALLDLGASADNLAVVYPCPHLTHTHVSADEIEQFRRVHHLTGKRIILTVGRLVERKGHDQVIKALPVVLKRVPDAAYLIAGSGPHGSQLRQLAHQNRLGNHVTFLDSVDDAQLAICYEACDLLAMPSRQIGPDVEGFGIVYLEANLFGKPVIAGRSGGSTEAVLNNLTGMVVEPEDTAQIAQAIIKLLTDRGYADRLGFQGMQRVLEEFSWDRQAEKISELLS